jgi:hypothetical protein
MENATALKRTWFQTNVENFEKSRFAMMTILMTAQSCLGSIAAMYSLVNTNYVLLGICAFITMASNSAFIAQASAAWCLRIFGLSVLINAGLIILNLIM